MSTSTYDGIMVLNENKLICFINQPLLNYLDLSEDDLLAKNIDDIRHYHNCLRQLPGEYCNVKIMDDVKIFRNQFINHTLFHFSFQPYYQKTIQNIRSSKERLRAIINSLHDGIWVTDCQGKTILVNKASADMCGVNQKEMIGKNVSDLEKEGIFFPSATLKSLKEKRKVTLMQTTRSGRGIAVTATPIFDDNGQLCLVINNARDITEINRIMERLEKTEGLIDRYKKELTELRQEKMYGGNFFAKSKVMQSIVETAHRVAKVESSLLILGESGVGKNVLAKYVHRISDRREGPFIEVNCGAIPENLMESEMFGYAAGAFTGARKSGNIGKFELADGGTLFLNEIGELSMNLQVKLLQVLQEKKISPVGSNKVINIDFRLITATNKNLKKLVEQGSFREDLYYRLNVIPINIPPLRQRKEDIVHLVLHFLKKIQQKYGISKSISGDAMECLLKHEWPGNIRELENFIERLVVTNEEYEIHSRHVNKILKCHNEKTQVTTLKETLEMFEKEILYKTMLKYQNTYKVGEKLGISQPTVVRKLRKYGFGKIK